MPRLLVVHHTPSPALQELLEAVVSGARTDEVQGVEVILRPALTAAAADVLQADGYLLGTPANIGYMYSVRLGPSQLGPALAHQPSVAFRLSIAWMSSPTS
jgi:multimeric flavodoxin WrbA